MSIDVRFRIIRDAFELNVDFSAPATGITTLFGPSGSGKTSLLRAIAGLDRHAGYLCINDHIWQDNTLFLAPHARSLGYVFQEASLFAHLTVQQNIDFGLRRVPQAERVIDVEQVIALLDIESLLLRMPATLSGGERQRVAIARALAVSPRLLLMDEPLSGLDALRKQEILPYLAALPDEFDIPVIYVSHVIDEVARLADNVVLVNDGRVDLCANTQEIFTRLDLPLARGSDAEALIEASVIEHDEDYQLTYLDFEGGRIAVAGRTPGPGTRVRLRILARDVSLTLERQAGTSIQNIFPATVDELLTDGSAQVTVRLLVAETPLLARVTRKSVDQLDLKPGKQVYAQAKSVAVLS